MSKQTIYQFYAELDDFSLKKDKLKIKIWRRFKTKSNITVAHLGYILQVLFEMTASHLMRFESIIDENTHIKVTKYAMPFDLEEFYDGQIEEKFRKIQTPSGIVEVKEIICYKDATNININKVLIQPKDNISFVYDFGDNWNVTIKLEKILSFEDSTIEKLPLLLEGNGFGIIEDVGGTPGLEEFYKSSLKKKGEKFKEYLEWLCSHPCYNRMNFEEIDLTAINIDDINFRLSKLPAIYKKIYEHNNYPSQKSIDLIQRKYLISNISKL